MDLTAVVAASRRNMEDDESFPDHVLALVPAGVEYYLVDLVGNSKTYYGTDGSTYREELDLRLPPRPGGRLDEHAVVAALRAVQSGQVGYHEFLRVLVTAGVAYYHAFLTGHCVAYGGRTGDRFVEPFPDPLVELLGRAG